MTAERCVFCLDNGHLHEKQILARGEHVYLCVPRGQLVEGCLIIAPYRCIGCFAQVPAAHLSELTQMRRVVDGFYVHAYGVTRTTFYEQGRAGGGALMDAGGEFPHHAHLCCLPLAVDLHGVLARDYERLHTPVLSRLQTPYVYVDGIEGTGGKRRRNVYVARSADGQATLERLRLKQTVASLIGRPLHGDWRLHPGDDDVERVITRFTGYKTTAG
jgi:diadenosine tetraphosphate (Ap4A) HIT family hydrolase